MQITQWMAALMVAGSLCAGQAMAAETEAAKNPPAVNEAAAPEKGGAALGEPGDDCPMHKQKKDVLQSDMGKDGEPCPYPRDEMHMSRTGKMSKAPDGCDLRDKKKCAEKGGAKKCAKKCPREHDACDPAKDAAKEAK